MACVKTAVSLDAHLFEQVEDLSRELKMPRSRVFSLAVEDFVRRHQNQRLLEQFNAAYEDGPDEEEQALQRAMHEQLGRLVDDEWK